MDQPSLTVSADPRGSAHIMRGIMIRGLYLDKRREPGSWVSM